MITPASVYRRGLNRGDPSPYYNPSIARMNSVQNFLDTGDVIGEQNQGNPAVQPEYDWARKALQEGANANKIVGESAQNAIKNQLAVQSEQLKNTQVLLQNGSTVSSGGTNQLGAILRALGSQESGNNYGSVNKGSGALGRWQVMPSNVPSWSKQTLGHSVSTQQFLSSPKLQNAIVRHIFGGYVDKYGVKGALSAWYSGDPKRWNDRSHVSSGPSVAEYVQSILSRLR